MAILVLAGTNGAGKSSLGGATLRDAGSEYFNPDDFARKAREANPELSPEQANSVAWSLGKRLLESAIEIKGNFRFETTLGGSTITTLLRRAMAGGIAVHVWYAGLSSPELHLERVRARVARGGHDIPERDIRRRYDASRANLIELMPGLASLRVYDNSAEADVVMAPEPWLLLHMEHQRILGHCDLSKTPDWAKPILMEAFKIAHPGSTPRNPRR